MLRILLYRVPLYRVALCHMPPRRVPLCRTPLRRVPPVLLAVVLALLLGGASPGSGLRTPAPVASATQLPLPSGAGAGAAGVSEETVDSAERDAVGSQARRGARASAPAHRRALRALPRRACGMPAPVAPHSGARADGCPVSGTPPERCALLRVFRC
ncbi:hypothetical protein ABT112_10100 [Streptomyces sp. NPDC002055]|uniref:hypothetical protein n=1 Tax=Streptomyces sp. NPDC002055 TaxID=3154534 RepID=UPI0033237100